VRASGRSGAAPAESRYTTGCIGRSLPGTSAHHGVAGSLPCRYRYQYATPAMMPPAIGPTIQTHQFVHVPVMSAGPNHRAGFIAPPVRAPTARMSIVITRPIAKPPILFQAPRSSIAVPNTVQTRKNVATASTSTALPIAYPVITAGVPPFTAANPGPGGEYLSSAAAARGPARPPMGYTSRAP